MKTLLGAVLMAVALFVFLGPPKKHATISASPSGTAVDLVKTISTGSRVELSDHMVPGRFTVFAFHADW